MSPVMNVTCSAKKCPKTTPTRKIPRKERLPSIFFIPPPPCGVESASGVSEDAAALGSGLRPRAPIT